MWFLFSSINEQIDHNYIFSFKVILNYILKNLIKNYISSTIERISIALLTSTKYNEDDIESDPSFSFIIKIRKHSKHS